MRRALIVIAVLALSACRVDATIDVTVSQQGAGRIVVTATADADIVKQAPRLAEDLRFADAVAAGWTVPKPASTADGGLKIELTHSFATPEEATALLQSINGAGGPLRGVTLSRTVSQSGTRIALAGAARIDGLAAFTDPDMLTALKGAATPYADQIAAANLSPTQAVGVTLRATLPGKLSTASGTVKDGVVSWSVPLDGSQLDLATTAVDDHSAAKVWGAAANVALAALVVWCAVAVAFIVWVARKRKRRAQHRRPRAV
jgi:hypothetical protein